MKFNIIVFILLIPAIAAVILAGIMALKGAEGWGWFLLAAMVLSANLHVRVKD